jgi:hypothetical protein
MKDLVWSSPYRSWYKNGNIDGKVLGAWPRFQQYFLKLRVQSLREDWDIEYGTANKFTSLRGGKALRDLISTSDLHNIYVITS